MPKTGPNRLFRPTDYALGTPPKTSPYAAFWTGEQLSTSVSCSRWRKMILSPARTDQFLGVLLQERVSRQRLARSSSPVDPCSFMPKCVRIKVFVSRFGRTNVGKTKQKSNETSRIRAECDQRQWVDAIPTASFGAPRACYKQGKTGHRTASNPHVLRGLENAPVDPIMQSKRIDWSVGGLCRLGLVIIEGHPSCATGACTFTCPSERRPFTCPGGTDDW